MLMTRAGAVLIAIGSAAGLAISLNNYFMPANLWDPDSSVTGTAGALLVVVSSAILLLAALVLAFRRNRVKGKGRGRLPRRHPRHGVRRLPAAKRAAVCRHGVLPDRLDHHDRNSQTNLPSIIPAARTRWCA